MRSALLNWQEIQQAVLDGHIDKAFALVAHTLVRQMCQAQTWQRQTSSHLKTYFQKCLTQDHSRRLKLLFLRTLAFHPTLGNRQAQKTLNQAV